MRAYPHGRKEVSCEWHRTRKPDLSVYHPGIEAKLDTHLSAVEAFQRMLLTGFALTITLMGLNKARIGELDVGQEALVPIQLGLLQRKNRNRGDQAEDEHEGRANHDVRRAQAIEAVEGGVQRVDTHGELSTQNVYREGV